MESQHGENPKNEAETEAEVDQDSCTHQNSLLTCVCKMDDACLLQGNGLTDTTKSLSQVSTWAVHPTHT
ncbi:hypothetical protein Y1Q_0022275 [Alligator mississippiensis]|uniref:Uncharacterized protein n=1 Tax=Alligator mississippiensis TaxID=8496 RepID=A0A151P1A0_ALLMI|nr:hypothetical protein Y1Q_0022275 [Alligator mississippiensis]